MRKFFDKLASVASRAWNWLKGTRPARAVARAYDTAVVITGKPVLYLFYGGERRSRWFNKGVGFAVVVVTWEALLAVTTLGVLAWRGIAAIGRVARKTLHVAFAVVLIATALAWALFSVACTFVLAMVTWAINTLRNLIVRGVQIGYAKVAGDAVPEALTRYAQFREVLAYDIAILTRLHAGAARLSRRVIGDGLTHRIVNASANATCRLHPETYDFFFGDGYPFNTPVDGGESYALIVRDVTEEEMTEDVISEQEKSANWFISNGFVLIATDAPDKSDKDIFNEYVRERWANLNVAEVATDEYGRTWVIPSTTEPLFKDVSTVTQEPRGFADQEIAWMAIGDADPVARAYSYGRHWVASLADQDPRIVADEEMQKRERAFLHSKMKGGSMPVEHLLRGFDAWLSDHRDAAVSA